MVYFTIESLAEMLSRDTSEFMVLDDECYHWTGLSIPRKMEQWPEILPQMKQLFEDAIAKGSEEQRGKFDELQELGNLFHRFFAWVHDAVFLAFPKPGDFPKEALAEYHKYLKAPSDAALSVERLGPGVTGELRIRLSTSIARAGELHDYFRAQRVSIGGLHGGTAKISSAENQRGQGNPLSGAPHCS